MLNTGLLPRPWSCHEEKVSGYSPLIHGKVERVSRSKRNGWRATACVDDCPMSTSHSDTKKAAESRLEKMLDAYTEVHYRSKQRKGL